MMEIENVYCIIIIYWFIITIAEFILILKGHYVIKSIVNVKLKLNGTLETVCMARFADAFDSNI